MGVLRAVLTAMGPAGICLALLSFGTSGATFSDRVAATAGGISAATLPPPEQLTAQPGSGSPGTQLAWVAGTGDFATSWTVYREPGTCDGGAPSDEADRIASEVASPEYIDTTVAYGSTYCYAVRGAFLGWTSPVSAPSSVTVPMPAGTLFLDDTTGGNDTTSAAKRLDESLQRGYERFGCVLYVAIVGCIDSPVLPDSYIFLSSQAAQVVSHDGWSVQFAYTATSLASLLTGSTFGVDTWYIATSSPCGGVPSAAAANYIAGSTASGGSLLTLLSGTSGTATLPLTGNASMTPSPEATLCMRVWLTSGAPFSLVSYLTVIHGPDTWLRGPFTQP